MPGTLSATDRSIFDQTYVRGLIRHELNPWEWVYKAQQEAERRAKIVETVLADINALAVQEAVPAIQRVGICEICKGVHPLVEQRCPECRGKEEKHGKSE